MDTVQVLLDRILADKAAQRLEALASSWPEKIATIERLRDASALARAGMAATRAKRAASAIGELPSGTAPQSGR